MKKDVIKYKLKDDVKIKQQKGRRIPIQLKIQVDKENEKLLKEGHIENFDKVQNHVFM